MEAITFDAMPRLIAEMVQTMASMRAEIASLRSEIATMQVAAPSEQQPQLILGRFAKGEMIHFSDKRLIGDGAPFASYYALKKAKEMGCPFVSADGSKKGYRILAESLAKWLDTAHNF